MQSNVMSLGTVRVYGARLLLCCCQSC